VFQIALFVAGAFVLYLVLKRFMKQWLALLLALVFLVHPMNSQIVFSIACLQDTLMLFFGITALYVLITRTSWRSLFVVAACLLLTLFCKESGLAYVAMAFVYIAFFDRKRMWKFVVVMAGPIALYLVLKTMAVGLLVGNANGAPIDHLSLGVRLLTSPSIVEFYFGKFIFPLHLSTCWYWTEQHFSVFGVLIPILIDMIIVSVFVWLGIMVGRNRTKADFYAYLFFAFWAALGIVPYLQIAPLDMTACETWFSFSMIGVLAMLGLSLPAIKMQYRRIQFEWVLVIMIIVIAALCVRTIVRGTNYSSQYNIAVHDLAVSKDDYSALNNMAQYMIDHQRYEEAITYAQQSIAIFAGLGNYDNLGVAYQLVGKYDQAAASYNKALTYGTMDFVYENLGQIYLAKWQDPATEKFLKKALDLYPQDYKLLTYMAIVKGAQGNNATAKEYIVKAVKYGPVPDFLYVNILNNQPMALPIPTSSEPIIIK
jgi:Tfp pilus assembly protein PilF/large-conductance mechanosensitive channel